LESLLPEERFEVRETSALARVGGYVLLWTMVVVVCYAAALVAVAKP
jgi:hypothetical protein